MIAAGIVAQAVRGLLDEDGRPVAEVGSPLYDPARTELVACPYHDARQGQPMNLSALRQMTSVWGSLLDTARCLAGPRPTVADAWRVAVSGLAEPLMHVGPVPRAVSAFYKTSLGMSQVLGALLLQEDGVADQPFSALGKGRQFYRALDGGAWLIGEQQACAGTEAMIVQMADALGEGTDRPCALDPAFSNRPGRPWGADAAIAVHVAHVARLNECVRADRDAGMSEPGRRWIAGELPPWLRAVLAMPERPAEHARRLFGAGRAPAALEDYLGRTADAPVESVEAAFRAVIDGLDAQITPA